MPKMRVLLIYPSSAIELTHPEYLGSLAEPLALEYLSAAAKADQHDVMLLDLRLNPNSLLLTLKQFDPDLVCLTGLSMHVLTILRIVRTIKLYNSACRIMVGGHHATVMPEDYYVPEIDYIVEGLSISQLSSVLREMDQGNKNIKDIPGVYRQTDDLNFSYGGPIDSFSLDELPLPDRKINGMDPSSYYICNIGQVSLLRTSVGCPYQCNFCALWRVTEGKYYVHSISRVIQELELIQSPNVFIADDESFVKPKRMIELATAIRLAGIQKQYYACLRLDSLLNHPDVVRAWVDIGLRWIYVGVEAISSNRLSAFNKKLTLDTVERGLKLAMNMGLEVFSGFIVHTDFTRQDFKELSRFIEHNKLQYPLFSILTPLPGTPSLKSFNSISYLQDNGRPNWDRFDLQHPVTNTRLPETEFMQAFQTLRKTFCFTSFFKNYNNELSTRG